MAFSANSFIRRAQAEPGWTEGCKERWGNTPSGMCEKCQGHPRGYGDRSTYNEQKHPQRGPWERGWVKVSKKMRREEERSDGIKGKVDVAELMFWTYNRRWITDDPASDIPVTSGVYVDRGRSTWGGNAPEMVVV
ncbi:hypothetical protein DFH07DRAFT_767007 [Mycena maculata]|uniref:Uncharacterized protein n=1 Tax=Mycena maculata TaxID=230809 RepID=A0AAD7NU15_9AGAR|nr:hypothetical protein DFH07DRAFT_767007 [Mycena maculata]